MINYSAVLALFALLLGGFGCGERSTIVENIPDAENSMFTSDGRLFITGGQNIYEIVEDDENGFAAEALHEEGGMFLGMVEFSRSLYVLLAKYRPDPAADKVDLRKLFESGGVQKVVYDIRKNVAEYVLLTAPLADGGKLVFDEIYTFDQACMPNGMAIDSRGRLYIADTTYLPVGKIVRIDLSQRPLMAEDWLPTKRGLTSPNGLKIVDDRLFFTDLDLSRPSKITRAIKTVTIDSEDGTPGTVRTLFQLTGPSLFDDLIVERISGDNYFVVTDYFEGRLLFLKETDGTAALLNQTDRNYFASPTAVARGRGMFDQGSLVVTEKGIIFDHKSRFGNQVSLFTFDK